MNFKCVGTGQPLLMVRAEPQVKADQNFQQEEFTAQSQKVNAYWVTNLTK